MILSDNTFGFGVSVEFGLGYHFCGDTFTNCTLIGNVTNIVFRVCLETQKKPVVDLQPNGKWRLGDVGGKVPKGHDCILEGFLVRGGKVVKKGTVTYVPNNSGEINYIFRKNYIG